MLFWSSIQEQLTLATWGMGMVKIQASKVAGIKQQYDGDQGGLCPRTQSWDRNKMWHSIWVQDKSLPCLIISFPLWIILRDPISGAAVPVSLLSLSAVILSVQFSYSIYFPQKTHDTKCNTCFLSPFPKKSIALRESRPVSTAKRAIELHSTVGVWLWLNAGCCLLPVMFRTLVHTHFSPFLSLHQ